MSKREGIPFRKIRAESVKVTTTIPRELYEFAVEKHLSWHDILVAVLTDLKEFGYTKVHRLD